MFDFMFEFISSSDCGLGVFCSWSCGFDSSSMFQWERLLLRLKTLNTRGFSHEALVSGPQRVSGKCLFFFSTFLHSLRPKAGYRAGKAEAQPVIL